MSITGELTKEYLLDKLNNKTIKDPNTDCWLWNGAKDQDRHGQIRINHKLYIISRLIVDFYYGLNLEDKTKMVNLVKLIVYVVMNILLKIHIHIEHGKMVHLDDHV